MWLDNTPAIIISDLWWFIYLFINQPILRMQLIYPQVDLLISTPLFRVHVLQAGATNIFEIYEGGIENAVLNNACSKINPGNLQMLKLWTANLFVLCQNFKQWFVLYTDLKISKIGCLYIHVLRMYLQKYFTELNSCLLHSTALHLLQN